MAEKFVIPIHGGDHCPGGPDPIPCLTTELEYAGLSGISPVTVNSATWTTLTGWVNVINSGPSNYLLADTSGGNHLEITQAADPPGALLLGFGAAIEWGSSFAATRRLRVGPTGTLFPTGSGLQELFLGEEGSINDASMIWQYSGSVGVTTSMTFEVWQDSGSSKTVTGSTGIHIYIIGHIPF